MSGEWGDVETLAGSDDQPEADDEQDGGRVEQARRGETPPHGRGAIFGREKRRLYSMRQIYRKQSLWRPGKWPKGTI